MKTIAQPQFERPLGFNAYAWLTYNALASKIKAENKDWNLLTPIPCKGFFEAISKDNEPIIGWQNVSFLQNEWNAEWAEELTLQARTAIQQQRLDQAKQLLELALRIEPTNTEALLYAGIVAHKLQAVHSALHHYTTLINLMPSHSEALARRALMHFQLKLYEKAEFDTNRALAANRKNLLALRIKVGLEAERENFDAAEKLVHEMIAIEPQNEKHFERLADIQILQQRFQQAKITLDHLLKINPENAFANYELAMLLLRTPGQQSTAKTLMQRASNAGYEPAMNVLKKVA